MPETNAFVEKVNAKKFDPDLTADVRKKVELDKPDAAALLAERGKPDHR